VDGQCDKLVTIVGHQFITLTVDICVEHGGREAPRHAGLSAAADILVLKEYLTEKRTIDVRPT